ncbi:hypothetical protein ACJX0J_027161, partial [Zea mays]
MYYPFSIFILQELGSDWIFPLHPSGMPYSSKLLQGGDVGITEKYRFFLVVFNISVYFSICFHYPLCIYFFLIMFFLFTAKKEWGCYEVEDAFSLTFHLSRGDCR